MSEESANNDFVWIGSDEQLQQFCAEMSAQCGDDFSAYLDSEADSLHHYQEKLCLLQLCIGGRFALVDTLALKDPWPLLNLLDRSRLWLHGADYDLTMLKRSYGWTPARIYDTQIAARLAGHRSFGLAALVLHHFQVTLCKSSQKEDWSLRPLPAKMQTYAVDDVRYLPGLADMLVKELEEKNRLSWFEESCAELKADVLKRQDREKEDLWRISGSGKFHSKGLALIKVLWQWRDGMAAERDVPPFRILNNQQMLTMAEDWEKNSRVNIPPRWRGKWRETFEAMLEQLRASDPGTWPTRPKKHQRRSTDAERARADGLCKARDQIANDLGIESSLLGSRAVMEDLVLSPEVAIEEKLMDWQHELLAQPIKKFVKTESVAAVTGELL